MRAAAAALVLALAVPGCVTRRVETARPTAPPAAPTPASDPSAGAEGDPIEAMAALPLRIECDNARIVVPERLRAEAFLLDTARTGPGVPPWVFTVRSIVVATREIWPGVEIGGDDFSIVAEGGVRTVRREGIATVEEGPFQTVILRNGRLLRR